MLYKCLYDKISELKDILKRKKIILFGTGNIGNATVKALSSLSLKFAYFVDNTSDETKSSKIYPLLKLLEENKDDIAILITSLSIEQISSQLNNIGFLRDVHYFPEALLHKGILKKASKTLYGFEVGRYSYGYEQFYYQDVRLESIGSFCSIAPNVQVSPSMHPTKYITTNPIIYYKSRGFIPEDRNDIWDVLNKNVTIGNDVWIGTNVIIFGGVTVGNGAVIGAGTIVTKDVPDYAIVVGVPARILRYRFSPEQINSLNKIKWWDWSDEKIKQNIHLFTNNDAFFDKICSLENL